MQPYTTRMEWFVSVRPAYARLVEQLTRWRDNPDTLRRALRESPPGQILVCALMGIAVGAVAVLLHEALSALHITLYGLQPGERLSASEDIPIRRILMMPLLGGLVMGLLAIIRTTVKLPEVVDPIEANAMHGGQLSLLGSSRLVFSSFVSNMFGASVGMEAAYTQMGSALFSFTGKLLHLRREDMRIFVAAGASAAIAAAFNAPLAGAFYGFELILGAYTVGAISQVAMAALGGTLVARLLTDGEPIFALPLADEAAMNMPDWFYGLFMLQGILAAGIGILMMTAVTRCEHLSHRVRAPEWLRPMVGGLLVAVVACIFPQVLGSGQGAINAHLHEAWPLMLVLVLLVAKIAASVFSVGLGFRGGLFSTSLFIGCLFGQVFGLFVGHFLPEGQEFPELFMLVGMGAVGASVVGAPVTIVLLVLEMTGNFPATTSVLMGVLIASAITRYGFGYSFSTWRFHVRGLRIQGAQDVGWVHAITVRSLMRGDCPTVESAQTPADIAEWLALRRPKRVFVVDAQKRYMGMIDASRIAKLPAAEQGVALGTLAQRHEACLLPQQNIRDALEAFRQWEVEELPVVESYSREVIGYLSEAYALRRYATELESRNLTQYGTASPPEEN